MSAPPMDVIHERASIASEGLRLEGVLSYAEGSPGRDIAVLVCPHPCLGGDMENSVILALEAEALRRGFATLRWNHRGVGESEGTVPLEAQVAAFWEDPRIHPGSEPAIRDLHSVIDHASAALGGSPERLILIGYSYGAVLSLLVAAQRSDISALVMISPPIHQMDGEIPEVSVPTVVTRAGADDIGVDEAAHAQLIVHLTPHVSPLAFGETDHFYRGHEETLARGVMDSLLREI